MRRLLSLYLCLFVWACNQAPQDQIKATPEDSSVTPQILANNTLASLDKESLGEFQWINPPKQFRLADSSLFITASKGSDYFNNPENGEISASAPYFYQELSGDFVLTTCIQPNFQDTWNAGSILLRQDSTYWIKFAFENSDATGPSIVSVVTREVSDDANGVVLNDADFIWLRMIKKDNLYSMLWSRDGQNYTMARLAAMPVQDTVQIGLEAQCPVGEPAEHRFWYYSLEKKRVKDLRKGE